VKKRLAIGLAVTGAAVLLILLVIALVPKPEMLQYQGKSVRDWALQSCSADQQGREQSISAFKALGSNAVPGLVKLLKARNPFLSKLALSIAPSLPSRLQHSLAGKAGPYDAQAIRRAAARCLPSVGPAAIAAVPALMTAMRTGEPELRWEAATALAHIGKPAVPDLTAAMSDKDPNVRHAAAYALGEIGLDAQSAIPALLKGIEDANPQVQSSSTYSLSKLGPLAALAVSEANARAQANSLSNVANTNELPLTSSLLSLAKMTRNENPLLRRRAIEALGPFAPTNSIATKTLVAAMEDPDTEVRLAAIKVIEPVSAGVPSAFAALTARLKDESAAVREHAARGLGNAGPLARAALNDLASLQNDNSEPVRVAAKEAVAKINGTEPLPK
jgi:HEAT repeat protein